MSSYPIVQLYGEMAFISYHFHWSFSEVMSLEHGERKRWCEEISKINRKLSNESENIFSV